MGYALPRPPVVDGIIDDRASVRDELITMAIIFQIVISAEPTNVHEVAARAKSCRTAHPGEHDIRAPSNDLTAEPQARREVEQAPEGEFGNCYAGLSQALSAGGIA